MRQACLTAAHRGARQSACLQTPLTQPPSPHAGQLCVTRSHPGQPRPYTGVVSIVSGEVAEDLATYLVRLGPAADQLMPHRYMQHSPSLCCHDTGTP